MWEVEEGAVHSYSYRAVQAVHLLQTVVVVKVAAVRQKREAEEVAVHSYLAVRVVVVKQ